MQDRYDVVIIGAGLFGQTIRKMAQGLGMSTLTIDDDRSMSGSKPAGCLIKPSWLASMSKPDQNLGMAALEKYWGVNQLEFRAGMMGATKRVSVWQVPPDRILAMPPDLRAVVRGLTRFNDVNVQVQLEFGGGMASHVSAVSARHVVVATGMSAESLVQTSGYLCHFPKMELKGKAGASFRVPDRMMLENIIRPWAPYKQIVAYAMPEMPSPTIWVGDGSTVKPENLDANRLLDSERRCLGVVGLSAWPQLSRRIGVRPYANTYGKPCYFEQWGPITVVTGGAKNGTIAAAWAAAQLEEQWK